MCILVKYCFISFSILFRIRQTLPILNNYNLKRGLKLTTTWEVLAAFQWMADALSLSAAQPPVKHIQYPDFCDLNTKCGQVLCMML